MNYAYQDALFDSASGVSDGNSATVIVLAVFVVFAVFRSMRPK